MFYKPIAMILGGVAPLCVITTNVILSGKGRESQTLSEGSIQIQNKTRTPLNVSSCGKINVDPRYRSFVRNFASFLSSPITQKNSDQSFITSITVKFLVEGLEKRGNKTLWEFWISNWDSLPEEDLSLFWRSLSDITYKINSEKNKLEFHKCYRGKQYIFGVEFALDDERNSTIQLGDYLIGEGNEEGPISKYINKAFKFDKNWDSRYFVKFVEILGGCFLRKSCREFFEKRRGHKNSEPKLIDFQRISNPLVKEFEDLGNLDRFKAIIKPFV